MRLSLRYDMRQPNPDARLDEQYQAMLEQCAWADEDLAVLDIISGGRLAITAGMGYRPHEFEMFGVDIKKRLKIYMDTIEVLRKAWTGQPFEFEGRTVRVTPTPLQMPGPRIMMGGSTEASAVRAAKLGYDYMPGHPGLYENYKQERRNLGMPEPLPNQGRSLRMFERDVMPRLHKEGLLP